MIRNIELFIFLSDCKVQYTLANRLGREVFQCHSLLPVNVDFDFTLGCMGVYDLVRLMIIIKSFYKLSLEYGEVVVTWPLTGILMQAPGVCIQKSIHSILIFQTCTKSCDVYLTGMQFKMLVTA